MAMWVYISVHLGFYSLLSSATEQIVSPFGYTNAQSTTIITTLLIGGVVGVFIGNLFISRDKQ